LVVAMETDIHGYQKNILYSLFEPILVLCCIFITNTIDKD